MATNSKSETVKKSNSKNILRFAHPFFTTTPHSKRAIVKGVGKRMTDFIKDKLLPIPEPQRKPPVMKLSEVIGDHGEAAIRHSGAITFHATGDTGDPKEDMQESVADAMSNDYHVAHPGKCPAFFLHLGDVIYYKNTDVGYHEQFYEPYKKYPGKIIAIAGNHDGELFKYDGTRTGQKKTLEAFQKNFCQHVTGIPPASGAVYREMISQPGVYWLLDAPFVYIIGLYSNVAEGPGYIECKKIGTKQKDWLAKTLAGISAERKHGKHKALIIAVHHPPFSNGGHASSTDMLVDIDDCCKQNNIMPDAVLAAHAHNYQRYTRTITIGNKKMEIPFIVAGGGGHNATTVKDATGQKEGDHTYDKSLRGYGYLTITVTKDHLTINFIHVEKEHKTSFDKITVDLKMHTISSNWI